jgi:putative transcriptional regulator
MASHAYPPYAIRGIVSGQWTYWCTLGMAAWSYVYMPQGSTRGRRRPVRLELFYSGALRLSTAEHAVDQPARVEHLQPADAVRDRPVAMRNTLPELRAQRGWTQGELAERLGVSRQTVNAVETERYEPSLSLAFAIAKLFELPIETIFRPGRK